MKSKYRFSLLFLVLFFFALLLFLIIYGNHTSLIIGVSSLLLTVFSGSYWCKKYFKAIETKHGGLDVVMCFGVAISAFAAIYTVFNPSNEAEPYVYLIASVVCVIIMAVSWVMYEEKNDNEDEVEIITIKITKKNRLQK